MISFPLDQQQPSLDKPVTLLRAPHVTQDGALWVFASQQPDLAEPQPYGLYAVADPGGDLTARQRRDLYHRQRRPMGGGR